MRPHFTDHWDTFFEALKKILELHGHHSELSILNNSTPEITENLREQWNEETYITYIVYLQLTPVEFAKSLPVHEKIENLLQELSKPLLRRYANTSVWFEIAVAQQPKLSSPPSCRLGDQYLGGGGYADVWEAWDQFERPRAIKIIHKSKGSLTFVQQQAKALARVEHPNVIRVHDLVEVRDPKTNEPSIGILMDRVQGQRLSDFYADTVSHEDALRAGTGILDGLAAIHAAGIFHNDLHDENVLISSDRVVIIDILQDRSPSSMSTKTKDDRLKSDIRDAWILLQNLLKSSGSNPKQLQIFDKSRLSADINAVRKCFFEALAPNDIFDESVTLLMAMSTITDSGFVESEQYASAFVDSIPNTLSTQIINSLLNDRKITSKHRYIVKLLLKRLSNEQRKTVVDNLSDKLMTEVPSGKWIHSITLLSLTFNEVWGLLPPLVRMRLENAIAASSLAAGKGALGTWATVFWPQMSNLLAVCNAVIQRLHGTWYSQNYIGNYFLRALPRIAESTKQVDEVIAGLKVAYQNDAHKIKSNINSLPEDWIARITSGQN
jgi:serine/threonine protein kinase